MTTPANVETVAQANECIAELRRSQAQLFLDLSEAQLADPINWQIVHEIKGEIARSKLGLQDVLDRRDELRRKETQEYRQREFEKRAARRVADQARQDADVKAKAERRAHHEATLAAHKAAKEARHQDWLERQGIRPDLTAVKAMLVAAIEANFIGYGRASLLEASVPGDPDCLDIEGPTSTGPTVIDADKLAATVVQWFASRSTKN